MTSAHLKCPSHQDFFSQCDVCDCCQSDMQRISHMAIIVVWSKMYVGHGLCYTGYCAMKINSKCLVKKRSSHMFHLDLIFPMSALISFLFFAVVIALDLD